MPSKSDIGLILQGLGAAFNPALAPTLISQTERRKELQYQQEKDQQALQMQQQNFEMKQKELGLQGDQAKFGIVMKLLQNSDKFDEKTRADISKIASKFLGFDVNTAPKVASNATARYAQLDALAKTQGLDPEQAKEYQLLAQQNQLDVQQKKANIYKTAAQTAKTLQEEKKTPTQSEFERQMNEYTSMEGIIQSGGTLNNAQKTRYDILKNKLLPDTSSRIGGEIAAYYLKHGNITQKQQGTLNIIGTLDPMKSVMLGLPMMGLQSQQQATGIDYGATPTDSIKQAIDNGQVDPATVKNELTELLADPANADIKGQIIQKAKDLGIALE